MKTEPWKQYADAEILARVSVRLITPEEKVRWDALICERHYLGNAHLVGRQLHYVAELDGQWIALVGWNIAAYHFKGREAWIGWTIKQQLARRKFVMQNSRYLLLIDRGAVSELGQSGAGTVYQAFEPGLARGLRASGAGGRELCRSATLLGELLSSSRLGGRRARTCSVRNELPAARRRRGVNDLSPIFFALAKNLYLGLSAAFSRGNEPQAAYVRRQGFTARILRCVA